MKIFVGGQASRDEFKEVLQDIVNEAERAEAIVVQRARIDLDEETREFSDKDGPSLRALRDVDLFALFRSFPNEFGARDVEALRRTAPLAPIVLISGALCEGEERTGEELSGVRRYYPTTWRFEGREELANFLAPNGAVGWFAAPATATRVDYRATVRGRVASVRSLSRRVFILADDGALVATLRESFESAGSQVATSRLRSLDLTSVASFAPERVIVDAVDLSDLDLRQQMESLRFVASNASIDLLAFSPRSDEIDFWSSLNVRVVAKPFDLHYLLTNEPCCSEKRRSFDKHFI